MRLNCVVYRQSLLFDVLEWLNFVVTFTVDGRNNTSYIRYFVVRIVLMIDIFHVLKSFVLRETIKTNHATDRQRLL